MNTVTNHRSPFMNVTKITQLVCAGMLIASPLKTQAQTFNLKDMIKKGIAEGSAPAKGPDASKDVATQVLPEPGMVGNVSVPKVLETLGVRVGDTRQQVDKTLTSQGYTLASTNSHLLGMHFQGILWSLVYVKKSGRNSPYQQDPMVDVRFGPQSGKVLAIRRKERFDNLVVTEEIKRALTEKYGTPTSQGSGDMNWVAYRPGATGGGKNWDRNECKAAGNVNLNGSPDRSRFKDCRMAVSAMLSDSPNSGREYQSIEVMVTDFTTSEAEFAVAYAAMAKKESEVVEQHRKTPVPKL
jgi:hypothetical protein